MSNYNTKKTQQNCCYCGKGLERKHAVMILSLWFKYIMSTLDVLSTYLFFLYLHFSVSPALCNCLVNCQQRLTKSNSSRSRLHSPIRGDYNSDISARTHLRTCKLWNQFLKKKKEVGFSETGPWWVSVHATVSKQTKASQLFTASQTFKT